jgi:hypothetical protein
MNPTTGIADCCARAVSGHATTVVLKSLMNSRRLMGFTPLAENHLRKSLIRSSSESYYRTASEWAGQCPVCANKPHHATIQNSAIGVAFALSCHRNMPTFREIKGSGCAFGGQEPRR